METGRLTQAVWLAGFSNAGPIDAFGAHNLSNRAEVTKLCHALQEHRPLQTTNSLRTRLWKGTAAQKRAVAELISQARGARTVVTKPVELQLFVVALAPEEFWKQAKEVHDSLLRFAGFFTVPVDSCMYCQVEAAVDDPILEQRLTLLTNAPWAVALSIECDSVNRVLVESSVHIFGE